MDLKIDALSKQFENKPNPPLLVLDNINLTIKAGEFVSLLGPSGCGKSTLLSMVAGLQKPSSGSVYLGEEEIRKPGPDRGVVFQESALFPWMNVRENVMFPIRKKMTKKEQLSVADKYLQMVQLSKFPEHYPHELSGGMQQRVSIARVLAMNPELLLMDEPFGALDEQTRSILQDEIEKIWLDTKKTVIFVTHSIREAIKLSDRIIIMGARPGTIISDFNVNLGRPRLQADMAKLEEKVMAVLKSEIDKVMQEELSYAGSH
ncbi:nitrate/sulfonate/bicarbonate ABC transporter ATP-binding protein [Lentibacillus populi]|uniref:Nitrate/sulfonate/bicarbonate ABC transporter ATP-binding protein n=1 Tax=Lentibacillus populi TaxID=1827502 RepID=A0A9W5TYC0_9BACI|nr:ABC transporter ATP-binding protein [Lentibacillus populi]GGB46886.1 nitrate/sulfonate/bicarbonate ABC transporter ATP-binding protein [Lentibacillus populi]